MTSKQQASEIIALREQLQIQQDEAKKLTEPCTTSPHFTLLGGCPEIDDSLVNSDLQDSTITESCFNRFQNEEAVT